MWSPTSITNTTNIFQHKACSKQNVMGNLPEEFIIRSPKGILTLSKEIIRSLKEIRLLKRVKIATRKRYSAAQSIRPPKPLNKRFDSVVQFLLVSNRHELSKDLANPLQRSSELMLRQLCLILEPKWFKLILQ